MRESKINLLLQTLSLAGRPISAQECSELLEISTSGVKVEIKELNNELLQHGACIQSKTGRGNGYCLKIEDHELFHNYLNAVLPKRIKREIESFSHQEARIKYLIERLLNINDYVKAEELIEELNISKSQLSKDLKTVRDYFDSYGIRIINRPYYGINIEASEMSIRLCLADILKKNSEIYGDNIPVEISPNILVNEKLKFIKKIIINQCNRFNYLLSDITCQNIVTHLFVTIKRTSDFRMIQFGEKEKQQIQKECEYELAKCIIQDIQHEFNIQVPDDEIYYCAIHLSGKKIIEGGYTFDADIMSLIKDIIKKILERYNIDFSHDLNLRIMLGLHIIPLLSRIKYNLNLKNPLLDDIKSNMILAYDIATCCASVINQKYDCYLSENEISYFALHFKLALEENQTITKRNLLLVCSTGKGSVQLLKYEFIKRFGSQIGKLSTCNSFELPEIDLSGYDCIFTTVPLAAPLPIPVFQISCFLNSNDEDVISKVLVDSKLMLDVIQYFDLQLFLGNVSANSKEELLAYMVEHIKQYKKIPDNFLTLVLEREELANTNLAYNVALPHPNRILTNETFACVAVLKKPLKWTKTEKVQVVILCSFEKGFARNINNFFTVLSELITSKKRIQQLVQNPTYEVFLEIIKNIQ